MKVLSFLFLLVYISLLSPANAQTAYQTSVNSKLVKTLQVKVAGQLISQPFIELNGEDRIEINFDGISQSHVTYAYSIIHCNGDWTQSSLSPIEYMNGFQGMTIDDFANSFNTTTQYTNYQLMLPNDNIQFKVSGNYVVSVYNENTPNQIAFTACFSVVEPLIGISASVSGNTDIDFNQTHQQVSINVNNKNFPIPYPQTDLKMFVYQDNRRDNAVSGLQPTSQLENQISYQYNRKLIFDAGNEYRRIEFLSNQYYGMGVKSIQFHNPYYHVELMADHKRCNQSYQYDQDQDGRFFIRCSGCQDSNTDGDYFIVHFTLAIGEQPDGNIYLNGDIFNNVFDDKSLMVYNAASQQYEKSVLMKEGSYNYQYLFVPTGSAVGQTAPIEGNYYQTENEYTIVAFYRPMGARYDRLIGMTTVKNALNVF
ncbi:MAG: DUF5103 domain-containing protein [Tannerellaceae bacterium]